MRRSNNIPWKQEARANIKAAIGEHAQPQEEKVIGKGQFGSSSLCTDLTTGEKAIVTTLRKEVGSKQLNSYRKDVIALRHLNHPNIARYIDSFEDDENSCIVKEYADGGDLSKLLKMGRRTNWNGSGSCTNSSSP